MKIADEKGRLFGKINIIDLLVIIVILAAVCFALCLFCIINLGTAISMDFPVKGAFVHLYEGGDHLFGQSLL